MGPKISLFVVFLSIFVRFSDSAPQSTLGNPPRHSNVDYSVTNLDIRDAILSLVSVLRDQMGKLERHEVRERQLGEQLTRSLNAIEKRGRGSDKNIENIASYIMKIDEKGKFLQDTLQKQAEDRRLEHEARGMEIGSLKKLMMDNLGKDSLPEGLVKKIETIEERVNALNEMGSRNSEKFDSLVELWKASTSSGSGSDMDDNLLQELSEIKEALAKTAEIESQILSTKLSNEGGSTWQKELIESMDSQRRQLALLEEEIEKAMGLLGDLTNSASGLENVMGQLENDTKAGFESIDKQVVTLMGNSNGEVGEGIAKIHDMLKSGQKHLELKVKEAETAVHHLQKKMSSGFTQISGDMKGVESILLDTGDSVLDTKRRLEYGVQQVVNKLEFHNTKLNKSLQGRFDDLASFFLGNQNIALKNLTSRMEEEISQVWRQIGILYHQMSKSAHLLDEIHSQTSKYVNNSESMSGKVGQITNRMGEVDDNLNYLLGRMSLVVQEFNMIKGGLGDALSGLKDSFSEFVDSEIKPKDPSAPEIPEGDQDLERREQISENYINESGGNAIVEGEEENTISNDR